MRSLFSHIIRPFAFLRTEAFEVLRQPWLVLTLVLGPFLILSSSYPPAVRPGYQNTARALRALFVVSDGDGQLAR